MTRRHPLPAEVFALVEETPATVLLEGGKSGHKERNEQPWTQLFTTPVQACAAFSAEEIPALFAAIESTVAAGQQAAGFFSYECGSCFEPKAGMREGHGALAHLWRGSGYTSGARLRSQQGEFAGGEPPELARFRDACARRRGEERDRSGDRGRVRARRSRVHAAYRGDSRMDSERRRLPAQLYRADADRTQGGAAAIYARLRARQPIRYGAFVHWQAGRRILSFSPELFFRIESDGYGGRRIVTRPMKGTARRGRTTREDRRLADWLANDPKNRSENVMIVDLVRNDLGRIAQTGSVRVEQLLRSRALLHALADDFDGQRRAAARASASTTSFARCFPCGSVTGAPKVRAMQLIARTRGFAARRVHGSHRVLFAEADGVQCGDSDARAERHARSVWVWAAASSSIPTRPRSIESAC